MLNTYDEIKAYVLGQANELTDGTSDWDSETDEILIDVWRGLIARHPWLCLRKNPPGAFVTVAPVTTLTLTAAAGLAVVGTLSATYATSLTGRKIQPAGNNYFIRITAHTAASASVTLDAVPTALTASAITIYQDEFDLATDFNQFVNGLWTTFGEQIMIKDEEWVRREYPGPVTASSWPPRAACVIGSQRVQMTSYAPTASRVEYPYIYIPSDPDPVAGGGTTLGVEARLRTVYAHGALGLLLARKSDARAQVHAGLYEAGMAQQWERDIDRMRTIQGEQSHQPEVGPYG